MKPNLTLACSVTESHLKEFLLLKFSAELFHECEWFLTCDKKSFDVLKSSPNCCCSNGLEKNGRVFGSQEEIANFYKIIDGKFRAAEMAIKTRGHCLLVDSDIVFCGELAGVSTDTDASICPHYQWNPEMDKAWGVYNVGFVCINNLEFLEAWEKETFSGKYEFEQVPIQIVAESGNFRTQRLPIQHNMGWWRFNSSEKRVRANSFESWNDSLWFDGNLVSSFHFHSFIECQHSQNLKDFCFKRLFTLTTSGKKIAEEYNRLLTWSAH